MNSNNAQNGIEIKTAAVIERSVTTMLCNQDGEIDALEELAVTLEELIAPVMIPPYTDSPEAPPEDISNHSPVMTRIHGNSNRIAVVTERFRVMRDRIKLH